jgi:hypothetical protein
VDYKKEALKHWDQTSKGTRIYSGGTFTEENTGPSLYEHLCRYWREGWVGMSEETERKKET